MAFARRPMFSWKRIIWLTGRLYSTSALSVAFNVTQFNATMLWICRVQSLFDSLGNEVKGTSIGLGGDGRYFNKEAVQTILKLAAGAGVKKVFKAHTLLSPCLRALVATTSWV